jgi:hypothetical protein
MRSGYNESTQLTTFGKKVTWTLRPSNVLVEATASQGDNS